MQEAVECYNEYLKLFKSDEYINRKKYNLFYEKYKNLFFNVATLTGKAKEAMVWIRDNGQNNIQEHNDRYIESKLIEYKDYFDNLFKDIDDSILLDEEQRKAILLDEDYSLIIAGAGSGKTTTMAAKVKFLIDKCNIDPNKIIIIALTKKAVSELSQRINSDFKLDVKVQTFHQLGYSFVRRIHNEPISVALEDKLRKSIIKYFKQYIFPNKTKFNLFQNAFDKYVSFDSYASEYDDYNKYYSDYIERQYKKCPDVGEYIKKAVLKREKNFRTINGEFVKSRSEAKIANYLYENGYSYQYEQLYPHKIDEENSYVPDFTVKSCELEIYIEFFGMATYLDNGKFTNEEEEEYNNQILKKQYLHNKYGSDLIDLYFEYESGENYLDLLAEKLKDKKIIHDSKKNSKQIFRRLYETNSESQYFKFINLCQTFITQFKEKGNKLNDFNILMFENPKLQIQLQFMKEIYNFYNDEIHSNSLIDFSDMINYAYDEMYKLKSKCKYMDYDYLIIDEYQDISYQRYNLAKKLSDIFDAKIVAVGDDWQSIFAFSGSDVDLFTNFYKYMGYAEIAKITHTYRNSQELIDVAGEFVSKNESQYKKNLVSNKHLDKPIEINYYEDEFDKYKLLENIIGNIYNNNPNHKILLIGRYNDDFEPYIDSGLFRPSREDKIICHKYPQAFIEFMTIHKSKGLGYDQVVLINGISGIHGFPSMRQDEELIRILKPDVQELIEYPEERRLFYVALTRTKNKLYILSPLYPMDERSEFIREIVSNENVLEVG